MAEDIQDIDMVETRVCLVGPDVQGNQALSKALQKLNLIVVKSSTGEEFMTDSDDYDTVFVLAEFEGPGFEALHKSNLRSRVLGPSAVVHCAEMGEVLPSVQRPLYCTSMKDLILCFTGFRQKEKLSRLVDLVHFMGGSIRKDFSTKVTHLVANSTSGDKYRVAVSLGTPIMTEEWVHQSWQRRHTPAALGTDEEMLKYKMQPFFCCMLSFHGFSEEETEQMKELTKMQGGTCTPVGDTSSTHLVIDDSQVKDFPQHVDASKVYVVKQEWFWASIQIEARADEMIYQFKRMETPARDLKPPIGRTPTSRGRKRPRLKETTALLAQDSDNDSPLLPARKRRSGAGPGGNDAKAMLSMSGSFLDYTETPEHILDDDDLGLDDSPLPTPVPPTPQKPLSARHQRVMELTQTEKNYVNILQTIVRVFKEPLENKDQLGGLPLAAEEVKTIFGSIPEILDVHTKLRDSLSQLVADWSEEKSIGDIICKYKPLLLKAYPKFVNFFEMSKETLQKCMRTQPRFHAFLKIQQSKPECCRETLGDLLIRPVQRLPSIILLLTDILKKTDKSNPDHLAMEHAIAAIKDVLDHINEDKRRTEGQVQMFDVVNEVEGCPADVLSSHRQFIGRVDVLELGGEHELCGKGEYLTLFLMSDLLEVSKKRHSMMADVKSVFKSPGLLKAPAGPLKHVELFNLAHIKRVVDIRDTEECKNAFGLVYQAPGTGSDEVCLYMFTLLGSETTKKAWLKSLCRHMANTTCKADAENFLHSVNPEDVELDSSAIVNTVGFNRIARGFSKKAKRVTRQFSFSKTPRRMINRAVSMVMSPARGGMQMQREGAETPLGDLQGARNMASSIDLQGSYNRRVHTIGARLAGDNKIVRAHDRLWRRSPVLTGVARRKSGQHVPMSPMGTLVTPKKTKSVSLGHSASKRL
ncbi:protein ECT2-like isoform X1 [Branchiostoma lanceolatum]|uniref:protein ECT2-like isoform X1 n=1 Tax=Branchiostoma lanceolatum TaxID=7740 RepID=UPI003454926B